MPKRKRSKSREEDLDHLMYKLRKLEHKINKRRKSDSSPSSKSEAVIPCADTRPASPSASQTDNWLQDMPDIENIDIPAIVSDELNDESNQTRPDTAQPGPSISTQEITTELLNPAEPPVLETDVMAILGEDPSTKVKYGPDVHKELANRLIHVVTEGLNKETRKDLISKYPTPANCILLNAPKINPELKAALPEVAVKRDKGIEIKQSQMTTAISGLSEIINSLIVSKDKNNEHLQKLMDTCRILCDIQHTDSTTRRNFILFALKNDMKEHLKNTKIDTFLFGENLAETLKSAKAVNKSGVELKADSGSKSTSKKTYPRPPASKALNRKPPPPARRPPLGPPRSREPAAPRALPPPPPHAHSSRPSYTNPAPPPQFRRY